MRQYVVDAFTDKVFSGNPAAVCVLDEQLPDYLMQNIAIENNLSETAYAVRKEKGRYLLSMMDIKDVLKDAGYTYDPELNQFR